MSFAGRWPVKRYNLICGTHNGLELLLILLIILTRDGIVGPKLIFQIFGFSISALGLSLLVYAGLNLRRSAHSEHPTGTLATNGPYRLVRHPYYLGDILLILGLSIGLRSIWGFVATLFLLIPSAIYVARLEEEMLEEKFGDAWKRFVERTYFMFPFIY